MNIQEFKYEIEFNKNYTYIIATQNEKRIVLGIDPKENIFDFIKFLTIKREEGLPQINFSIIDQNW